MSNEPEKQNRSSAPSPEQLAVQTDAQSKAIQEAVQSGVQASVQAVFASLAPLFEKMALTPEKIQELKSPFVDPSKAARERREQQLNREQIEDMRKQDEWRKAHCEHKDKNDKDSIGITHNFPDRQPRGVCVLCHDVIHPREWRIGAPDPATGKTQAYMVAAHKDYHRVLRIDSMIG